MKHLFNNLISDTGTVSMTRFLTLIITAAALFIAVYSVITKQNNNELVGILLGSGLSAKVAQKFAEEKHPPKSEEETK